MLKQELEKLRSAVSNAQTELTNRKISKTNLSNKLSEAISYLATLTKNRYKEFKATLQSVIQNTQALNGNTSKTTEELVNGLKTLEQALTNAYKKQRELDNYSINFTANNPQTIDVQTSGDAVKYKEVLFEITSDIELDSPDDIGSTLIINSQDVLITNKSFKGSTNKVITAKFKVYENGTYQISALRDLNRNFGSILSYTVSGFVQSTGTVEQNPNTNNQSTKPTIESVETPSNTLYNELSTVFEEWNVLNLYEPKYYLYLIDGEKVAKYLPKVISYNGKKYELPTNASITEPTVPESEKYKKIKTLEFQQTYNLKTNQSELTLETSETETAAVTHGPEGSIQFTFVIQYLDYSKENNIPLFNNLLDVNRDQSNNAYSRKPLSGQDRNGAGPHEVIDGKLTKSWANSNDNKRNQSDDNVIKNRFVFNVKNNQTLLLTHLDLYISDAGTKANNYVLPAEFFVEVSQDGTNYERVKHQNVSRPTEVGTFESNTLKHTSGLADVQGSTDVKTLRMNFEPILAKYIKFQWKPRPVVENNNAQSNSHYSWGLAEVRFYSVSEQLETLKQTYLVKETEKTNILDKLTTLIDYYKNLTDTSTNRYAVVIEKSKQLSNQLTNQKELLKSQKPETFKANISKYIESVKEFESDLTKANSQNSNNNFDIEQGLKATRTLLKDLYAYLPTVSAFTDNQYANKVKDIITKLEKLNNSTNKTKTSLFNAYDKLQNDFENLKSKFNDVLTKQSIISVEEDSFKVKTIGTEKYEVSLDILIHHIKQNETGVFKLNNEAVQGITVSEIEFNTLVPQTERTVNNLPLRKTLKFTITGQPERLSTISFDKVLLGTNVIHSLDQRKELKLQKLESAATNFTRSYDIKTKTYKYGFELPEGLSLGDNPQKMVEFKLQNNEVKKFNLLSENNTYSFFAQAVLKQNNQEQNDNSLYLTELSINFDGTEKGYKNILRTQENTDITWMPENPKWHLKDVDLIFTDVFTELGNNPNQSKVNLRIGFTVKNPELLVKTNSPMNILASTGAWLTLYTGSVISTTDPQKETKSFISIWYAVNRNTPYNPQGFKVSYISVGFEQNNYWSRELTYRANKLNFKQGEGYTDSVKDNNTRNNSSTSS
ncbi:hypothetical protein RRG58_05005 [Mycoplasmopsis cynos]|nr:hypothetical protein [Mycoplasmopsis felis]WQQ11812.1 hypothetical protein RRG50_00960 [Mycoplasmopsis felis]